MLCMRCYAYGKVQGVWYRATAKEQAEKLDIKGWARNMPDGRVEVFACGKAEHLESFFAWMREGPPLAKVSHVTREDEAWQQLDSFKTF